MTRLKRLLIGRDPRRTLVRCVLLAVTATVVFGLFARPVRVRGISMYPTLTDRSIHFINLAAYWHAEPERGDLVAVSMPGGRAFYMKRLLGLPGEILAFEQGRLLVDGQPVEEPYLRGPPGAWNMPPERIPPDHYFIAGDNRATVFEGHTLGFVHRDRISGRLLR